MAGFEILFKESVWKDLKKVPKNHLIRILSRIEKLKDNPRPNGCEKLTGQELYRTLSDENQTKVIFMTGAMTDIAAEAFLEGRESRALIKPFSYRELRDAIDAVLADGG